MLFIQSELSDKTESYKSLISELDYQVYKIAKTKLDNIRFGFNNKVNYNKYNDIIVYREILSDIMFCASGMCDVNTEMVISKVKKLINSPC